MNKRQVDELVFGRKEKSLPIKEVVTSLLVLALIFTFWAADFSSPQYEIIEHEEVVVRSGDTLWSLASNVDIDDIDTGRIVDDIRNFNEINPGDLRPGMSLKIPVYKEVK